jgi:sec-independent protein translocase protein TatB
VFNVQGSEMIFLLLIALVVLGPEKLPDAVRRFTKAYSEFKKMASGFQDEFRDAMDEPMRELRETANLVRDAAKFDLDVDATDTDGSGSGSASPMEAATPAVSEIAPKAVPAAGKSSGLNFGTANPKRQARIARPETPSVTDVSADAPSPTAAPTAAPIEDAKE